MGIRSRARSQSPGPDEGVSLPAEGPVRGSGRIRTLGERYLHQWRRGARPSWTWSLAPGPGRRVSNRSTATSVSRPSRTRGHTDRKAAIYRTRRRSVHVPGVYDGEAHARVRCISDGCVQATERDETCSSSVAVKSSDRVPRGHHAYEDRPEALAGAGLWQYNGRRPSTSCPHAWPYAHVVIASGASFDSLDQRSGPETDVRFRLKPLSRMGSRLRQR